MCVADLAHALEVAVRRREAAAGVLHRLEDDGGDGVGPLELDPRGDRLGEVLHAVARCAAGRAFVFGTWQPPGVNGSNGCAQARDPGRAEGAERRAVVGDFARDDLRLVGVAGELVVLAATLSAVSTASPPPDVKKTRLRSPGVSDAIFAASSIARGCA